MARPQFNSLLVKEIHQETATTRSVMFDVPAALKDVYAFKPGQYLTLRAKIGDEELRRPYSLCVAPAADELRICVKKIDGGRFSGFINDDLQVGQTVDVLPPMGRFTNSIDCAENASHFVGFAGGVGITPIISNIQAVLQADPQARYTLFYGSRTINEIIFRDLLAELKDRYLNRFRVFHILSEEIPQTAIYAGLLDDEKVRNLVGSFLNLDEVTEVLVCGPAPMMEATENALIELGLDKAKVKIESFGNRPVAKGHVTATIETKKADDNTVAMAEVDVVVNGVAKKIQVPFDGESILDVAHGAQIEAPFSCKSGVCCTCKAKLLEGRVTMDVVYGLEPDEIAAGYILTCQAHPVTDKLVIDYDG